MRYFFFVFLFFHCYGAAEVLPIVYLTFEQNPSKTMVIRWITSEKDLSDTLEYHVASALEFPAEKVSGTHFSLPENAPYLIHQVILKNLNPFTEYKFRINRIADVYWKPKNLIFEVQCSSITAQEVLQRNQDYRAIGLGVVWILHDQRYNGQRHTSAENVLQHSSCYFTNIDEKGNGFIYDQFEYIYNGCRYYRSKPLKISLDQPLLLKTSPYVFQTSKWNFEKSLLPQSLQQRLQSWTYSFEGDLLDQLFKSATTDWINSLLEIEKKWDLKLKPFPTNSWMQWIKKIYLSIFHYFLAKLG